MPKHKAFKFNSKEIGENAQDTSNLLRRTTEKFENHKVTRFMTSTRTQKQAHWKKPKIAGTKELMWIEYTFRVPDQLRIFHRRGWKRFKVYEEINRIGTMEYARDLRAAVEKALRNGYNPFYPELYADALKEQEKEKVWTAQQGVLYFKQTWQERGLEPDSIKKYNYAVKNLLAWFNEQNLSHIPAMEIERKHINAFLYQSKKNKGWSNRTFNNEKDLVSTIFNFMYQERIVDRNPCHGIQDLRAPVRSHRFYDEKTFASVKEYLSVNDPYLLFAFQVIYYLCVRSEKELKYLKVGNIFPERKQVLIRAEDAKTDTDRFIPCCSEMMQVFYDRKIFDYPKEYYVFSVPSRNKFLPDGQPGEIPFGKGFFSKRFISCRKELGLSSEYTPYGMKHTRIIHLKMDGVPDADIMALTGHKDFVSYAKYLRDLGLSHNPAELEKKTRKF